MRDCASVLNTRLGCKFELSILNSTPQYSSQFLTLYFRGSSIFLTELSNFRYRLICWLLFQWIYVFLDDYMLKHSGGENANFYLRQSSLNVLFLSSQQFKIQVFTIKEEKHPLILEALTGEYLAFPPHNFCLKNDWKWLTFFSVN